MVVTACGRGVRGSNSVPGSARVGYEPWQQQQHRAMDVKVLTTDDGRVLVAAAHLHDGVIPDEEVAGRVVGESAAAEREHGPGICHHRQELKSRRAKRRRGGAGTFDGVAGLTGDVRLRVTRHVDAPERGAAQAVLDGGLQHRVQEDEASPPLPLAALRCRAWTPTTPLLTLPPAAVDLAVLSSGTCAAGLVLAASSRFAPTRTTPAQAPTTRPVPPPPPPP